MLFRFYEIVPSAMHCGNYNKHNSTRNGNGEFSETRAIGARQKYTFPLDFPQSICTTHQKNNQNSLISMGLKASLRRLVSKRKNQIAFKVLLVLGSVLLLYNTYILAIEHLFFHQNYIAVLENHPQVDPNRKTCILPSLDPWDERAKQYFFHVPPVTCQQIQPYLTQLTPDGVLRWNRTEPSLNSLIPHLDCEYQEIDKNINSDKTFHEWPRKKFTGNAQLIAPFVKITCSQTGSVIYHNVHAWLPSKIVEKTPKSSKPNVQIFILDAVSQPNFIRQLPSTYDVLTREMTSIVMTGMVKLGSNTYPNVGAILTGEDVYGSRLPPCDESFDSWPIIWKNFSRAGYVTIFGEDVPEYDMFNYLASGFKRRPTDIYMRPFWMAINDVTSPLYGSSSEHCFGNLPQHTILLDYIKRCTESLTGYPFFMLTNLMQMSHDELNLLQTLDADLSEFFRWFRRTSPNTILVVMGDHGINFGHFRSTQLGRVESAFPFFGISIPESLSRSFPHLERNLRRNRRKMASWFDVYDTLMDVVTSRFDKPRHQWSRHGFSLFYQLPGNRTCQTAGIPSQFCPCEIEIPLGANSTLDIKMAAAALVGAVNRILSVEPRCPALSLSRIKSAIKILPNMSTAKAKGFVNIYRIVVDVLPSHALLEGLMQNDAWVRDFVLVGSVTRLDRFGNSTHCVADRVLRNFCYCK